MSDALCLKSLTEVAGLIRSSELSSREVVEAQLARIDALDPRLHAYATVIADEARSAARQADRQQAAGQPCGPLHGVPIAVKDLCDSAGVPTAAGMPLRADNVPSADATVLARLRAAGAILVGKLQMTEGAFSAHHPDIVAPINPWGEQYWPGVSSSGSGVATAAGLCFGSLGSDTLGSIRFPSAANGITGLKPTWGRVSRAGVFPLAESLDHVGPMARTVADVAAMLQAIAGADEADPTASVEPVPDYMQALGRGVAGLRIGIDLHAIAEHAEASVTQICEHAEQVFSGLGAEVVDIRLPPLRSIAADALQLCVAETAYTHRQTYPSRREAYGPVLAGLIDTGRSVDATTLIELGYRRAAFTGQINAIMQTVDLVLMPAMNRAAPTLDELARQITNLDERLARLAFTAPFDLSGHPCLTLPGGATAAGVPIAFQLMGAHFDEATVLAAGHAFQQATQWHLQRPPLAEI